MEADFSFSEMELDSQHRGGFSTLEAVSMLVCWVFK